MTARRSLATCPWRWVTGRWSGSAGNREGWSGHGPIILQAAGGDRDLRASVDTIEAERATGSHRVVRSLAERFGLRPGLTVVEGADIGWTLTSPDVVDRLVVRRGWSWPRFQEWLVDTVHRGLFG